MNKSAVLLTTTKVFVVQSLSSPTACLEENFCSLRWKCGALWVRSAKHHNTLAALQNSQWLKKCLQKTSANLVCVDLNLGEAEIKIWADSCSQVKKKIFVRLDPGSKRTKIQPSISWIIKLATDKFIALSLLLFLSPVFFVLIVLLHLKYRSSILSRDWNIGKGGRLFQSLKFNLIFEDKNQVYLETINHGILSIKKTSTRIESLDRWMQKYGLDKLPQLINVLWGEMSIVGPRALTLYEAIKINPSHRYYFYCLPGILNPNQVKINQSQSDINQNICLEYHYIENWSLIKDIRILFSSFLSSLKLFIF